ncbi:methyltransferase domain-containing protein [Aquisalimonas lutea]|uniref:SAM-dependent methyltransferase n=1 Tax=Aquisalimonas lutea TaxID=1327750 RepID=UPI0025B37580|nr:methyltransferase domain-containing protein [Aquisalimonas lutea]MDN3516092.1 methyltransferase domain-containing protein [Aquisalimonas lutea]
MSNTNYTGAVATAREYYNSDDADRFYHTVWGGEDIHVGLYESDEEPIADASRRTVAHMADLLGELTPEHRILDLGAGYGGTARYLAQTFGCPVVALNLSEVENERDREMNKAVNLDHLIEVLDASFEEVPYPDNHFDVVWSQDSFLHSGDREKVIHEAARVLKPGGVLIFTDPMQTDDCPEGVLQPILDRIHLETLGSPGFYRRTTKEAGLEEIGFEDHSHQLPRHYGRVLEETKSREDSLEGIISREYIERMKQGLQHWVNGGNNGYLAWGIFRFRKA